MSDQTRAPRQAGAFSPAVMIGLVLVGAFSFAAYMVLSAFEPELASGANGGAQALSQSAVGFAGAVRLLHDTGAPIRVGRTSNDLTRRQSLVLLTPERPLTWADVQRASGATTLLILPKWLTAPDPNHRGWVMRADAAPPDAIAALLGDVASGLTVSRASGAGRASLIVYGKTAMQAGRIDQLQTIAGNAVTAVVSDAAGNIVLGRLLRNSQQTNIYILADPDFLNTQGIADINNAAAGIGMIDLIRDAEQQPIVFDVTLNGLGAARSALRLAFQPPFLGFTLGFAIAAALLAWRAALRFGPNAPVQRAIALGKTALADNSAALIRLSGRTQRLGPSYARMTGTLAADKLGISRQGESDVGPALDRIGAAQGAGESYSQLAANAAAAKSSQQMLEAARKLYAWKKETTRAAR